MAKTKNLESRVIEIARIETGESDFCILGTTPVISNRMGNKAKHELLLPKGRKSMADRAASLKHDVMAEFLDSPYTDPDPKAPTLLLALATWFKQGMANAALDVPGTNRTQIGRHCWTLGNRCERERVSLYGIPELKMDVVRSADMNRTPDVRTRCVVRRWACRITVSYTLPMLTETGIANLLYSAGICQGVGDWRSGKGSANFGSYEMVSPDNPQYKEILKAGRKVQTAALADPTFYDQETEDLYRWYVGEVKKRGRQASLANGTEKLSSNGVPSEKVKL